MRHPFLYVCSIRPSPAAQDRVLAAYNKCGTFSQKLCCSFFVFVYFYNKFISCSYFVHKSLVYFKHLKRDGLPKIYSVMFSLHIKINFFIIASRYTRCRGALLILREKFEARDFSQCQKSRAVFTGLPKLPVISQFPALPSVPCRRDALPSGSPTHSPPAPEGCHWECSRSGSPPDFPASFSKTPEPAPHPAGPR